LEGGKNLKRNILTIGLSILLIFTIFTPMTIGFNDRDAVNIASLNYEKEASYKIGNSFLNYAEGAASFLINESIIVGDGYKWPDLVGGSNYYTDLYYGSPGIITLFSELYDITAKEEYYQYAVGGADWLIEEAIPEGGGYKWPEREDLALYYTGLYVGATGTGNVFLDLYEILSDSTYLDYATGAADWLISIAVFEGQSKCKWPSSQYATDYCTDIIYGASGIGLFLLRLYDITGNQEYLNYAEYTGNWLVGEAIAAGSGYKWAVSNQCPYIYTGFSHGTAGIGYYLSELYEHTNDMEYLEYAEGAGQYLIDNAVEENDGCKWWAKEGDTPSYSTGWCHGPAGTCLLFINLYKITNDDIYLTYAEMGSTWLISLASPSGGGYKWPHSQGNPVFDTTICHGAAGIGDLFVEMFELTEDNIYYDYAEGAAEWLKSVADTTGSGYRWATFGSYYTGFSVGSSGIGLFLLNMHEPQIEPDLVCSGNLNWADVKPGSTVTDSFYVGNIGDPGSLLDWEITDFPEWGDWEITPEEGYDITPEQEPFVVEVSVVAPVDKNAEFTGEVKIVNSENSSDICTVEVYLSTPRNRPAYYSFFNFIFERLTNIHPLLR
jgi:lantibiotic modifying enzyme